MKKSWMAGIAVALVAGGAVGAWWWSHGGAAGESQGFQSSAMPAGDAAVSTATPGAAGDGDAADRAPVIYRRANDELSVNVEAMPLRQVLANVMRLSAVEIRLDPAIARPVTMNFEALPLEDGLDRLTAGLNVIKQYAEAGKAPGGKPVLVGLVVLPAGEQDASRAVPVVDGEAEARARAVRDARRDHEAPDAKARQDAEAARWTARLQGLPPALRDTYEKSLAQRLKQMAERDKVNAELAQRSAAIQAQWQKKNAEMQKHGRNVPPLSPAEQARLREQLRVPETPEAVFEEP